MLYMISYKITEYLPGAYDDFFEALDDFTPRYQLMDECLLVVSDATSGSLALSLGNLMDPRDTLFVTHVEYERFSGSITSDLDRFITAYEHNTRRFARIG